MKILLIKFRNIGDVLLSTALIENLKLTYPDADIDFALNSGTENMLTLNPNINKIFIYNRNKINSNGLLSRVKEEIKYIKNITINNYDIVINLTEGERGVILAYLSGAKQKLGFKIRNKFLSILNVFDLVAGEDIMHTVEKDLQFINLLNNDIINKKVSIFWSKESERKINSFLEENNINEFIHIHPVSRWMFKCWEDDRMAKIIDYIQDEKNIKVIITAAPDDIEIKRVNNILSLCKTNPINLTAKLALKDMAYLSSKAKLFFGTDTAPMHIAAAVNTPVIALFGASYPHIWGPWDNNTNKTEFKYIDAIQKSGIHSIVSNTNHNMFYENDIKKTYGMRNITIEQVVEILDEYI